MKKEKKLTPEQARKIASDTAWYNFLNTGHPNDYIASKELQQPLDLGNENKL